MVHHVNLPAAVKASWQETRGRVPRARHEEPPLLPAPSDVFVWTVVIAGPGGVVVGGTSSGTYLLASTCSMPARVMNRAEIPRYYTVDPPSHPPANVRRCDGEQGSARLTGSLAPRGNPPNASGVGCTKADGLVDQASRWPS